MVEVSPARFEELVADALDGIPDELGSLMDNVAVFVREGREGSGLLGLYQGVPLTRREGYGIGGGMPDRITLYRLAILARCRDETDVVDEIRRTVVHEIGHHFGISDSRLRELGWG